MFGPLLLIFTAAGATAMAWNIAGVNKYYIEEVRRRRYVAAHPHSRELRRRPSVAVIVPTLNNEATIVSCLLSLVKNRYRKVKVLVADNGSNDSTVRLVRDFIKQHPKADVSIYAKRRTGYSRQLLKVAAGKCSGCELTLVLNKPYDFDPNAVKLAVQRFNLDSRLDAVGLHVKSDAALSTLGLLYNFSLVLANRLSKADTSILTCLNPDKPALYRRDKLLKLLKGNSPTETPVSRVYAANAIIASRDVRLKHIFGELHAQTSTRNRSLWEAWRRPFLASRDHLRRSLVILGATMLWLAALITPFMIAYFLYMAFRLHEPTFIVASSLIFSLILLFSIFEDEQFTLSAKLRYALLLPVSYGWFLLLSLYQYIVLLTRFWRWGRSA